MELRPYRDQDKVPTREIFERAVRLTASRDYSDEQIEAWAPSEIDGREMTAWGEAREKARTIVAVEHGEPVGFSDLVDGPLLDMLYVEPRVGRRGVATALLEEVLRLAREAGADVLDADASITACPFFERHGFAVVQEQTPTVRGVAMVNFRMRRPLT
jgi:putative acetyltransferase